MLTFQVLGGKQQAAYVMLLDKRFDMGRDGRAVKAHHEQLALCEAMISDLSRRCTHGLPWFGESDPPLSCSMQTNVSRALGRIARSSGRRGSPVEIFPDGVKLLRPSHGDHARRFRDDATWGGGWRREA